MYYDQSKTSVRLTVLNWFCTFLFLLFYYPRGNGAKRRSGRKPGARVTNSALAEFKVVAHGRWYVLTDLNNLADYPVG